MIKKLTSEQTAKLAVYRDKWIKIGLSTEPTNKQRAVSNVEAYYAVGGLPPPTTIVFAKSPIAAMIIASILTSDALQKEIGKITDDVKYLPNNSAVYSAVNSAVDLAVYSAVHSAVDSAVNSAVYSAVHSAVDSAVYSAVYSAVSSAVNSAVHSAVDSAVSSAVYSSVDSAVDSAVNSAVYSAVHSAVDSSVSSAVYSSVHSAVYSAVYSAVNLVIRDSKVKCISNFCGGNLWAGWQGFLDFFDQELGIKGADKIRPTVALSQDVGWIFPYNNLCVLTEKPTILNLDASGRLHNDSGKSIEWADGWGIYSLNCVTVPPWAIETPKHEIQPKRILELTNTEQRMALMKHVGLASFLKELGAVLIDAMPHENKDSNKYELYYLRVEQEKIGPYLYMKCPSSGREFLEGVGDADKYSSLDPTIKTCEDALKWRMKKASNDLMTKFNLKWELHA